jgi:hypothetical protein
LEVFFIGEATPYRPVEMPSRSAGKVESGGESDTLRKMFQVVARHEACRSRELRFDEIPTSPESDTANSLGRFGAVWGNLTGVFNLNWRIENSAENNATHLYA